MIIWINGAFGAGKTTIAEELNQQLPSAYLYDPESIGSFLQHNLPTSLQLQDFQDYPEWRSWNIHLLKKIAQEFAGDIIVPMTLYRPEYLAEIMEGLRKEQISVKHFQLEVSKEELIRRLEKRSPEQLAWGLSKLAEALVGFQAISANEKIDNQKRRPKEVVDEILSKIG